VTVFASGAAKKPLAFSTASAYRLAIRAPVSREWR
jgi:hypothetical protein